MNLVELHLITHPVPSRWDSGKVCYISMLLSLLSTTSSLYPTWPYTFYSGTFTWLFLAQHTPFLFSFLLSLIDSNSDVWEHILKFQVNIFHLLIYFESFRMADLCKHVGQWVKLNHHQKFNKSKLKVLCTEPHMINCRNFLVFSIDSQIKAEQIHSVQE